MKAYGQHLTELGFRGPDNTPGVWHYTLDERPVKVWKDPHVVAEVAWKKSAHPDLKIHMTVYNIFPRLERFKKKQVDLQSLFR